MHGTARFEPVSAATQPVSGPFRTKISDIENSASRDTPRGSKAFGARGPEFAARDQTRQEKATQLPRNWSALYQQRPAPETGDYFKAGHASFNKDDPELSGLLLAKGELLYAQKLRRLLSGHPLVFLNACESGRAANEQDVLATSYMGKPAEGLASALLDGGAMACVGALWPVYDDAAAEFAVSFYRYLLMGHLIGEALRRARVDSRKKHGEVVTWASFALYGDPTARLANPK
jgi:hypothetical protein